MTSQIQVLELVENIGLKIGEQLDNNASLVMIESTNIGKKIFVQNSRMRYFDSFKCYNDHV